ncbi:MAG: lysophospholipid acyltransferase family protein [Gammaproteobacteria bacterium]|jgi:1-acyl-sn-glycerol-3-phosphate acyltransferase|nr:lysophospholipid acyltransferase family protein [Gammaproteobacteria bacterium]
MHKSPSNRLISGLHKVWLVLIFAPYLLLSTLLVLLAAFVLRLLFGERRAGAWVAPVWTRMLTTLLPMRVEISGREHIDHSRAYVVVCNHESQLDILALYGRLGIDLRWIVKQEARKIPLIGWGCMAVGHVFVDRQNRDAAIASINAAVCRLEPGEGMMFFPEGTRSKSGQLMAFKSGAFRTALMLNMPILPVSIAGAWELLPPGQMLPNFGTVKLRIHAAMETADLDDNAEQARELMAVARMQIARGIEELERMRPAHSEQGRLNEN